MVGFLNTYFELLHQPSLMHNFPYSLTMCLLMNRENCALKLVDEIILYYEARSKKHKITLNCLQFIVIIYITNKCNQ